MKDKRSNAMVANMNCSTSTQTFIKVRLYGTPLCYQRCTEITNAKRSLNIFTIESFGNAFGVFFRMEKPAKCCRRKRDRSHNSKLLCYITHAGPSFLPSDAPNLRK